MKFKKIVIPLFFGLSSLSFAESVIELSSNENEILNSLINDDIETSFTGGESLFSNNIIYSSANDMRDVYSKNEARGDKKFKGKDIIISGVVDNIHSGIGDIPQVHLKTKDKFHGVVLSFSKDYQDIPIDLDKNQKVTFYCKGSSVVVGSPTLKNCAPIEVAKEYIKNDIDNSFQYALKNPSKADKTHAQIISTIKYLSDKSNDMNECKIKDANCLSELYKKYSKQKNAKEEFIEKAKSLGFSTKNDDDKKI
ncbi:OB-fold protein [Providencia sp. Me31A]|uniref:OB-fold protein n=1 Tax=Providencia sp. Me31A TaxID=3392637 RepID=UPI003D277833